MVGFRIEVIKGEARRDRISRSKSNICNVKCEHSSRGRYRNSVEYKNLSSTSGRRFYFVFLYSALKSFSDISVSRLKHLWLCRCLCQPDYRRSLKLDRVYTWVGFESRTVKLTAPETLLFLAVVFFAPRWEMLASFFNNAKSRRGRIAGYSYLGELPIL